MSALLRLSASERDFLVDGVEAGLRADGRSRNDFRSFEIDIGVAPQTNGSARLWCPHSATDILVGVKLEIAEPKPQQPGEGYLTVNVDCSAVASTIFQGRDVHDINDEIAQVLQRVYAGSPAVDLAALAIVPGAQCWVLFVDVLVLESGGNLIDFICLAVKAALWDTRIPKVTVMDGDTVGEGGSRQKELEVSDDPYDSVRLMEGVDPGNADSDRVPLCITLSRVGSKTVADGSLEEEAVMSSQLSVGVSPAGRVAGIQKRGRGAIEPSVIAEMLQLACKIGLKLHAQLRLQVQNDGEGELEEHGHK